MKFKTLLIIILIVAALVLIKIFYLSPKQAATSKQGGAPPTALIRAVIVKRSEMNTVVTSSGSMLANEEVTLNPETAGKIISLTFKEGTEVQKGQLLVKLNDADLQATLAKQLSVQKINEEKERDMKALLAIKGVSQEEYDLALSVVQQNKADIDYTQAQIAKTEIRAPFNGIIGFKTVSEGDFVSSADAIASIQQINPMDIDFSVPEKYSLQVHTNDTVRVKIAGTGRTYIGKVYAIDPKIDATTRALKVRASIDNSKREIFAGSYAEVSLILRSENSVVVPSMAVIASLRGQTTYLIKNGKANLIPINIGIRTDSSVEVLTGLKAGDTIATSGIMALKSGVAVKIQNLTKLK
ncbi:MAG TPA: efflux RND transporter periplasmic adaptor subunit [Bacteroidia bacterium]